MSSIRKRMTYANVVATLALIVAVAGGSTAIALQAAAPKNSVTTKSIRKGNVTADDLGRIEQVVASAPLNDAIAGDGIDGSAFAIARCPRGAELVGGGVAGGRVHSSSPVRDRRLGWEGTIVDDGGPTNGIRVTALCLLRKPK
ncbi:MAG: hypothetical protein ACXWGS_12645 [Solirubrobacterales bacterium]